MSSLVLELQSDALNSSVSTLDVLRKALVVARKLGIEKFQKWIELELKGYDGMSVPKYRLTEGQLRAWNPNHGWHPIRTDSEDLREVYANMCECSISQPISELIFLADSESNELQMQLPYQTESFLVGTVRTSVKITISTVSVQGIVEAVRDIILQWALQLEEEGVMGEGMTFSKEEKQLAARHDYTSFIQINLEQSQMQNSSSESQSSSESFSNDLRGANVANFANQVSGNARQQANQHIHLSESQRTLAEAAEEIQQLLIQLQQTNPTATEAEKVAHVNDETTPSFKRRVAGALQASGETAIDEFILDSKYLKVVKSAVKGWLQPDS